ncbi:hypothetical protein scyTo_0011116 [Scyliorhinus torazame]|uniref:Uncharacterized protein n=1 Tax=Scyliorhinus torazame TaxID=75743 RepID=A0A401NHH1_SCYTO|nr:hypothetical protein [Scyliorhinus torazame]
MECSGNLPYLTGVKIDVNFRKLSEDGLLNKLVRFDWKEDSLFFCGWPCFSLFCDSHIDVEVMGSEAELEPRFSDREVSFRSQD